MPNLKVDFVSRPLPVTFSLGSQSSRCRVCRRNRNQSISYVIKKWYPVSSICTQKLQKYSTGFYRLLISEIFFWNLLELKSSHNGASWRAKDIRSSCGDFRTSFPFAKTLNELKNALSQSGEGAVYSEPFPTMPKLCHPLCRLFVPDPWAGLHV